MSKSQAPSASQQAAAIEQILMAQAEMQSMLLGAYEWSFKACTSSSSGPQLSSKEKRCISQGVATFIDARSHIAQQMMQNAGMSQLE